MQRNFFKNFSSSEVSPLEHGGSRARGRRKKRRPLSCKKPLHLVLRSSKAVGPLRMNARRCGERVEAIVRKQARKFGVKLLAYENSGDHLHLLVKSSDREGFQHFLRSVAALVARLVTGAKKGVRFGRFWDALAYSRVLRSALDFRMARDCLTAFRLERLEGKAAKESFLERRKRYWNRLASIRERGRGARENLVLGRFGFRF